MTIDNIINYFKLGKYKEGLSIKYAMITFGFVIGLIILVIVIRSVTRGYSYVEVENMLKNSAIEYINDNKSLLPIDNNKTVEIDAYKLEQGGYIKSLNKLTKDSTCIGRVDVIYENNTYIYLPYLECGENFVTTLLSDKVINNKIVSTGEGIYNINNEFTFRGEKNINNYLEFNNYLWRIVKIDKNGNIKLILANVLKNTNGTEIEQVIWDDRYNINEEASFGINNYELSRIKEYSDNQYKENFITRENQKYLVANEICIGRRASNVDINDGSIECANTILEFMSSLALYEYILASIDSTCSKASDIQCQNYNYLTYFGRPWWILTGNADNTYQVYKVDYNGQIKSTYANEIAHYRPVVLLDKYTLFSSGEGTSNAPFKIR